MSKSIGIAGAATLPFFASAITSSQVDGTDSLFAANKSFL